MLNYGTTFGTIFKGEISNLSSQKCTNKHVTNVWKLHNEIVSECLLTSLLNLLLCNVTSTISDG